MPLFFTYTLRVRRGVHFMKRNKIIALGIVLAVIIIVIIVVIMMKEKKQEGYVFDRN